MFKKWKLRRDESPGGDLESPLVVIWKDKRIMVPRRCTHTVRNYIFVHPPCSANGVGWSNIVGYRRRSEERSIIWA